ncbi:hypothetical protein yc1106_09968 [Curvularia clavata]|uniref:6-phosphogluconate dehydrogenase C-terminal domain-like protein n=1 Tax=Curvularia clavata TaxID=95742 RepID=A0A9Q8ZHB0_CURCL|nr:hypothetical protein yc1106_09968 [Curvularia clavata]
MAQPQATIAILSIGQMGLGVASLLKSHNYTVTTNTSGRSAETSSRATSIGIQALGTDEDLVESADYILSIVPPRDAVATAERVIAALEKRRRAPDRVLYYLDLNAISPETARHINQLFADRAKEVHFIDGGIIGGPPTAPSTSTPKESATTNSPGSDWYRPRIPLSGPHTIPSTHLSSVLNTKHISPTVGTASGLKCCFAALSKGFIALALQSFTTASSLGVLDELKEYMDVYNPNARVKAEKDVVGCTGKAYRWVEEMRQIGECFASEGGWEQASVFREIAGVFQGLADVVEKEGREGMGDVEGVVGVLGKELHGKE